MNKKLTIEYIRKQFEKENYILLSDKYINNKVKLKYECPRGHKHSINWNCWQQGQRCPYCAGRGNLTIEEIKISFDKEGYTLLSTEYINNKHKLEYICPKGHSHSITWNCWTKGAMCWYCFGTPKKCIADIKIEFENKGYVLLDNMYKNNKTKLNYICPNGHKHNTTYDSWSRGSRCLYCSGLNKLSYEYVKASFEAEGYTLLSKEYINSHTKIDYICPNGHIGSIVWSDWKQGHRCFTCKYIKQSGPGNHSWKGGISFESYCEAWRDKEFIKKRDGNKCLNPDCWKKDKVLSIHHIDYNKKNCKQSNLITICRSCNSRANTDRDWHKKWYQAIIKNRYGERLSYGTW